ncbi:efflux RND transporter periplasmic adaptor subunit [Erwinia sp. AnSW2-5]|uniref:efflux RND transporter periplasmic adaptor subunit n=1 Tax=Erwinia sp. AnSW2-5 TaxID=3367692 RepID=UPI00385D829F
MFCAQSKRHYQYTLVRIVIVFFALSASGCDNSIPQTSLSPPLVRTFRTTDNLQINKESFTGTVVAKTQSNLSFRVAGKVMQKNVDVGQRVKKGQILARIDAADLLSQLNASNEAVLAAKAELLKATNNEQRFRSLVSTGAVSRVDYDAAKAQADVNRSALRSAESQLSIASNETGYAELTADVDGVITNTFIEPGEYVSAGQIVIQLAHQGSREAKINLPESQRPKIGETATAHLYSNNKTTQATLRLLSEAADPTTRTYAAHYTLDGVFPPLGSTVSLSFDHQPVSGSTHIPVTAINDFGQGTGVWCINEKTSEVSWCPVKILTLTNDSATVLDLNQDTLIVSLGAHLLRENDKVRYLPLSENKS